MRRPEDFTHHRAKLADLTLHYVREGKGEPLLLVHGWPGFWWEWHRVIGPLAEDFDVIVPDMRGFGDSEKPPLDRPDLFHMNHAVEDFRQLLDTLGIERAHVVGHDFGAVVAHKFMRRHPDRTGKVAIFNPIVPGFDELWLGPEHIHESWYNMFHALPMAAELVGSSREACRIYFRHFLSHWSHDRGLFDGEMLEIYVDNYMKTGNIEAGFNCYIPPEPWDDIDRTISDRETLFLQGMADTCIPSKWSDLVTRWYTRFSMEYVSDGGHFLMVEKPDLVVERLRGFLRAPTRLRSRSAS